MPSDERVFPGWIYPPVVFAFRLRGTMDRRETPRTKIEARQNTRNADILACVSLAFGFSSSENAETLLRSSRKTQKFQLQ